MVICLQTDWEKVAKVAKFKTPKYARDQWAIIKNKLGGASATSPTAAPARSKGTPSRKRKKFKGKQCRAMGSDEASMLTFH